MIFYVLPLQKVKLIFDSLFDHGVGLEKLPVIVY